MTRLRCPVCHGFALVMDKDFLTKPCHKPKCVRGWVEETGPIEAVVDADDYAQLKVIGDLGGVELC